MRFEVPQFIDVKDKIFGPFTLAQFIFLGGGLGLGYAVIRLVPTIVKWPLALVPAVFGVALAFYKVNGRPLTLMVQAFALYLFANKLFIWHQRTERPAETQPKATKKKKSEPVVEEVQPMTNERLRDLAWNLDILEDKD